MPKYRLSRRFYDGEVLHPVDTVLDFVEGTQPRTARPVTTKAKVVEEYEDVDDVPAQGIEDAQAGDTLSGLAKKGK